MEEFSFVPGSNDGGVALCLLNNLFVSRATHSSNCIRKFSALGAAEWNIDRCFNLSRLGGTRTKTAECDVSFTRVGRPNRIPKFGITYSLTSFRECVSDSTSSDLEMEMAKAKILPESVDVSNGGWGGVERKNECRRELK